MERRRAFLTDGMKERKERKSMKKNKMMRMASGLLVAALLTTSMISGTFAKYTTAISRSDTARVAKWGVKIDATGNTFANSYNEKNAATATVSSTDKVVAPGTNGNMATMSLSGTPEVAVKVSYTGEFSLDDNWVVGQNKDFYCPLVITVKNASGTTEIKQGDSINSKKDFEDAVNNAIAAYSTTYEANKDLSTVGDDSLTVTWSWPYTGDDTKDTALGDATTAANVTLKVTTTVTQID